MYRTFIPLLLLSVASAAPQDAAITYIKVQPNEELDPAPSYRASRIENIPSNVPEYVEKAIEKDILETSNENDSRNVRAEPTTEQLPETTEVIAGETEALTERAEVVTERAEVITEKAEAITERYEVKTTPYVVRTKPKFHSKLSYFEKPTYDSVLTNLIERPGRRKFRSRCRCERISNCPKLQITVPRCPEEQFMCCF